jgi:hypothetical protein
LNAIDNHFTYGARICSDLYNVGNDVYGFNTINIDGMELPKDGVRDELSRCQPIM